MCSICGGTRFDTIAAQIWEKSKDRGRDAHNCVIAKNGEWIGNHRATPTTEVEDPLEQQPVGNDPYFVFNGIISNDNNLGIEPGYADTSVLPKILNTNSLIEFKNSLDSLIGSFAIAVMKSNGTIYLACNYKPIWYSKYDGNLYFSSLKQHFPKMMCVERMLPYSTLCLNTGKSVPIDRNQPNRAIVICSSGLDSTAVASYACATHGSQNVFLMHYDYGCLATEREKHALSQIASYLGCYYEVINLPKSLFGKSKLLGDGNDFAEGLAGAEYAHEWVPARNLVMLSTAVAYAEANGFGHIYLGTNLEEAGAYPDNEEQFILDFNDCLWGAVQNGYRVDVHTPLGGLMKHEIVPFGLDYGAPFHLTWSCYRGGKQHCGNCGPCFMRRTAFERNGLVDPVFKD